MKKEMDKKVLLLLIVLVSTVFLNLFLTAAADTTSSARTPPTLTNIAQRLNLDFSPDGVRQFFTNIQEFGTPLFSGLFGDTENTPELIYKVFAFILVILVTYGILSTANIFGDRPWLNSLIGVIIGLIGVRVIPQGFLIEAAFPSGAFMLLIMLVAPFVLAGYLIMQLSSSIARRVLWVGMVILVALLWLYNLDAPEIPGIAKLFYPLLIIFSIGALWFDGTLKSFISRSQADFEIQRVTANQRNQIIGEIRMLESALAAATTPRQRATIQKQIQDKKKALGKL